jgi:tol-pal system protein YbgF
VFKNCKFAVYCLLFIFYCLLSGCATVTETESLRSDVNQLRRETFEMRKDLNDLKEKTGNIIKEDDFRAFRESQAEIQSRVSEISNDLQVFTGRFDENKYSMEKTLKDSSSEMDLFKAELTNIESQIKDIRDKLNVLESRTKEAEKKVEPKKETSQLQASKPSEIEEPKDKGALYEAAYDAFKSKKYKEAREKFEDFIKDYPQDELTDNAQFWVAETYYGEKDYEGAILAYEVVLKKYPKSEKTPGALLKQGLSFIEIGDRKTAKTILEKLLESYPDSKETELAKKKIEEIGKTTGKKKK